MKRILRLTFIAVVVLRVLLGQNIKQPLFVLNYTGLTIVSNPESIGTLTFDDSSTTARNDGFYSIQVTAGSGNWTATLQWSDTAVTGPWSSFGTSGQITQASATPLASGIGHHHWINISITGTGAATVVLNYTAWSYVPTVAGAASVAFPVTPSQGGTGVGNPTAHSFMLSEGASNFVALNCGTNTTILGQGASADPTCGTLGVAAGGTGLNSGTSGGIPAYTGSTTVTSSGVLTAGNPVIGGGAGVVPSSGSRSGNTTTFATTNGLLNSNHLASFDSNGNVVDSGQSSAGTAGSVLTITGDTSTTTGGLVKIVGGIAVGALNTDTGGVIGICILGCGVAGTQTIQTSGAVNCNFDVFGAHSGHYVQISFFTNGACYDSNATAYPNGTTVGLTGQILGRTVVSHAGAGAAQIILFPEIQTPPGGPTANVGNGSVNGTCLYCLAKISNQAGFGLAEMTLTTDTNGAIGIVISGAGTTGPAQIQLSGYTTCQFDGATTAGDYVQISPNTLGFCFDAGASPPASGEVIGRVLGTNGAPGLYSVILQIKDQ